MRRVDEYEGKTMSDVGQIYSLIPKIMREAGAVAKDRKNIQQQYAFRGIDDLVNALHAPMASNGVFVVPEALESTVTEKPTKSGGVLFYTRGRFKFTFYAPDGSSVQAITLGEAMDSGDKSSNKAMSSALKYALLQVYCIPTLDDDIDTENSSPQPISVNPKTSLANDAHARLQALIAKHNIDGEIVGKWVEKFAGDKKTLGSILPADAEKIIAGINKKFATEGTQP